MERDLALRLLYRLRVPRPASNPNPNPNPNPSAAAGDDATSRLLHTGEILGVARFWSQPAFRDVAFRSTRVCAGAPAPEEDKPLREEIATEPAVLDSGAHGPPAPAPEPEPMPAVPAAPETHPHGGATVSQVTLNSEYGLLASGGWDRCLRLWRMPGADGAWRNVCELRGHQGVILGLTWANASDVPAGDPRHGTYLISCSNDGRVICWRIAAQPVGVRTDPYAEVSGEPLWSWKGQDAGAQVSSITAAKTLDGRWLLSAVKQNGLVMLWDKDVWSKPEAAEGAPENNESGGHAPLRAPDCRVKTPFFLGVRQAALHPSGDSILVAGNDKMFKGWVLSLPVLRPDDDAAAAAGGGSFRIADDTPLMMEGRHEGGVRCLAVSGCGRYCASGAFGSRRNVLLHDVKTGALEQALVGHDAGVAAMAMQGQFLVTAGDDGTLRIWRWALGRCLKTLRESPLRLKSVAFDVNPSAVRIVGATEKTKQDAGRLLLWGEDSY